MPMTIDTTTDATSIATPLLAQMEQAWNEADGTAFGTVFTDDASFVDIRGTHHRGRVAIAHGHQAILDSIYAGSTVRYQLEEARVVTAGCVVGVAAATLDCPSGPLQGVNHSRLTVVATEQDQRWVVAAFHNTLVRDGS